MELNERGRRALARFRNRRGGPKPFLDRRTVVTALALAFGIAGAAFLVERSGGFDRWFQGGPAREDLTGFQVFLHRQGCPGPCPIYAVLVRAEGEGGVVEYEGVDFVATEGAQRAALDALAMQALARAARRAGMDDAPPAVKPGTPQCAQWRNGLELIQVGVTRGGTTHTVDLYPGCEPGAPALVAFTREIDALAGTARWVSPGAAIEQ